MNKGSVKILIVEDEAIAAFSLQTTLNHTGYSNIHILSNGEEAVLYSNTNSPDLIIMDIKLAGELSGIEAAGLIKAVKDVPIIIMTGYSNEDVIKEVKRIKPLAIHTKPLLLLNLVSEINSYFDKL